MSNSDNPKNGAIFQRMVMDWFQKQCGPGFELEKKIPIGAPQKDHKFDIVNSNKRIVIECKRYTWTETGNVPSAKMGFVNEAAFYLSFLSDSYDKYIVMLKSHHPKRQESLAAYYYRINRHLLGMIKVAEFDPESKELRIIGSKDNHYLSVIKNYLQTNTLNYSTSLVDEIKKRKAGKKYYIQDHIRGMVYSMLTNQTKWYRIQPHLADIDDLFQSYDPQVLLATNPSLLCKGLFDMKCGNVSTKAQMNALAGNIKQLQSIEKEYGSIDAFITSEPVNQIVKKLSDSSSQYKLKMLGEALVWEYLRNVGIDGAKPDTHLRRFLAADRMGTGNNIPATIDEVNEQIEELSKNTGMSKVEIDNLIWSFCADGYGEICTSSPHCNICPIRNWCKNG